MLAVAVWFGFIALFEHYSATRPPRPDTSSGRVYQLNNHGSYAYLTQSEQHRLWLLEFGAPAIFVAAVVLAKYWRIPTGSSPDIPRNVLEQDLNRPYQNYEEIRRTYGSDAKDADGT